MMGDARWSGFGSRRTKPSSTRRPTTRWTLWRWIPRCRAARGTVHGLRNADTRAGRLLSIYSAAGGEDFFREAGKALSSSEDVLGLDQPADLPGIDFGLIVRLAERHGMRVTRPD